MKFKRFSFVTVSVIAAASIGFLAEQSVAGSLGKQMPSPPAEVISPIKAMSLAKSKVGGGTPFNATLEFDEGHWVYGVMVVKGHKITEVEIDPVSGKVGDSEAVTPDGEAKEVTSELTKIMKSGG